jgi:hypothetical protein
LVKAAHGGSFGGIWRGVKGEGRKVFFFEKKKQKTFFSLGSMAGFRVCCGRHFIGDERTGFVPLAFRYLVMG